MGRCGGGVGGEKIFLGGATKEDKTWFVFELHERRGLCEKGGERWDM